MPWGDWKSTFFHALLCICRIIITVLVRLLSWYIWLIVSETKQGSSQHEDKTAREMAAIHAGCGFLFAFHVIPRTTECCWYIQSQRGLSLCQPSQSPPETLSQANPKCTSLSPRHWNPVKLSKSTITATQKAWLDRCFLSPPHRVSHLHPLFFPPPLPLPSPISLVTFIHEGTFLILSCHAYIYGFMHRSKI